MPPSPSSTLTRPNIYTGTIQREELENSEYELRRQYDFITLPDIYGENHRYLAQDFTDITHLERDPLTVASLLFPIYMKLDELSNHYRRDDHPILKYDSASETLD